MTDSAQKQIGNTIVSGDEMNNPRLVEVMVKGCS